MSQQPTLGVIVASVREGRVGRSIADWFVETARAHAGFDVTLLDLKEWDLPLLSEPNHPRLQQYTQQKTKDWSAAIDATDAFVLVTPEYNFSMAPALNNALQHVYKEWHYKAAAFVSYGGISGGLRGAQAAKLLLTTLKIVPIPEAVTIPFVSSLVSDGQFNANDKHQKSASAMLDELGRWTKALHALRQS